MKFRFPEIEHRYGPQVHLLDHPVLLSLLAQLCSPSVVQPQLNQLMQMIYSHLVQLALCAELPLVDVATPTRMTNVYPEQLYRAQLVNPYQKIVSVNLARAGTLPSQICYEFLNYLVSPEKVRQDHIFAARLTNDSAHVTGTSLTSMKIGGDIQDAVVLFPDPMGATGSTLISVLNYYKSSVQGERRKFIGLHLIVTPEYLRNVLREHPDVEIYALRVDRGLSSPDVLSTPPGTHWDLERGLDEYQYIVPGAGGIGEIMNNSFV